MDLSSNLIGNSNDETSLLPKLLLTDTQVSRICKAFANGLSANIKLWKTQLSKMIQSGGIFDNYIEAIPHIMLRAGGKVFEKVAPELAKMAAKHYVNKGMNKLLHQVKVTNNEIKDFMKIIKSLENRKTLINGTTTKISSPEGGFLNCCRPLMTDGLPLMNNLLTPLAKSVLISSGLTAAESATNAAT